MVECSTERGRRAGRKGGTVGDQATGEPTDNEVTDTEMTHVRRMIRRELAGERTTIELGPHSVVVLSWVVRWVAGRGQLVEWAPELFGRIEGELAEVLAGDPDGAALRRRGEPVPLPVGPYTALMLVGSIDWWLRQPRFAEHGPTFLAPVRDKLLGILAGDPIVLAMAERLD